MELKELAPESQTMKFEHTVGSHSDDRGGDSDLRCTCQDGIIEATDKQLENVDLFENAFYNWLINNGVDLAVFDSDKFNSTMPHPFIAKIDLNKLKGAILVLQQDMKSVNK